MISKLERTLSNIYITKQGPIKQPNTKPPMESAGRRVKASQTGPTKGGRLILACIKYIWLITIRLPDKSVQLKIVFLISQPKHML